MCRRQLRLSFGSAGVVKFPRQHLVFLRARHAPSLAAACIEAEILPKGPAHRKRSPEVTPPSRAGSLRGGARVTGSTGSRTIDASRALRSLLAIAARRPATDRRLWGDPVPLFQHGQTGSGSSPTGGGVSPRFWAIRPRPAAVKSGRGFQRTRRNGTPALSS